ncbi:MAG: YggS family pyridoxal phosphate-dependent enzyme [Gammaproteobacteria bacterium]|nr:MAG: YggS family pyridoxal phosphate-dependent enzyme [Gammaproteobacteria bacterium]
MASGPAPSDPPARPAAPRARLEAVRRRIAAAARAAGRDPAGITLVAVGKGHPPAALAALAAAGQRHFGESYLQEALPKLEALEAALAEASGEGPPPVWHFVGALQANKTRAVAARFHWVHAVDRLRIARRLSEQRPEGLPPLQLCLQVQVVPEPQKAGVPPEEALRLAPELARLPRLRLRGLMTLPPASPDPAHQRAHFRALRELWEELRRRGLPLDSLSMGMSGDLEAAVAEGATLVRVGTALFGPRPPRQGAPRSP